jgi:hypothetical protein
VPALTALTSAATRIWLSAGAGNSTADADLEGFEDDNLACFHGSPGEFWQ